MKKMNFSRKEINQCIDETVFVLDVSKKYVVDVYNHNKLNKEQTKGYIERLESCLDGFIYLESIVEGDNSLKDKIVDSIIDTIDIILGNSNNSKYHLSSSYVNELKNKRKEYIEKRGSEPSKIKKFSEKEKVVDIESRSSIIGNILCYITIFFLFIMFLGAIFSHEDFLSILVWLLAIISFIPQLKKTLIQKFGSNMSTIIIITRIVLLIGAFILLANEPTPI